VQPSLPVWYAYVLAPFFRPKRERSTENLLTASGGILLFRSLKPYQSDPGNAKRENYMIVRSFVICGGPHIT